MTGSTTALLIAVSLLICCCISRLGLLVRPLLRGRPLPRHRSPCLSSRLRHCLQLTPALEEAAQGHHNRIVGFLRLAVHLTAPPTAPPPTTSRASSGYLPVVSLCVCVYSALCSVASAERASTPAATAVATIALVFIRRGMALIGLMCVCSGVAASAARVGVSQPPPGSGYRSCWCTSLVSRRLRAHEPRPHKHSCPLSR